MHIFSKKLHIFLIDTVSNIAWSMDEAKYTWIGQGSQWSWWR